MIKVHSQHQPQEDGVKREEKRKMEMENAFALFNMGLVQLKGAKNGYIIYVKSDLGVGVGVGFHFIKFLLKMTKGEWMNVVVGDQSKDLIDVFNTKQNIILFWLSY